MEEQLNYFDIFFPKTPVEWGLLTLLSLLFGAGWHFYYHSEARWQAQLKKLRDDGLIDASADDSIRELITTSWKDSFLQSLPGIFLIIGLLGTFISLGTSLGELSLAIKATERVATEQSRPEASNHFNRPGTISLDETPQATYSNSSTDTKGIAKDLNKVLEALGTKFKTSIWGIILNLLFRLVFLYSLENILNRLMRENLSLLSHQWRSKELSNFNTEKNWHNELVLKNNEIITVLSRLATAMDFGNQSSTQFYKDQMLFQENYQRETRTYQGESLRFQTEQHNKLVDQNREIINAQNLLQKEVVNGNQRNVQFYDDQLRLQTEQHTQLNDQNRYIISGQDRLVEEVCKGNQSNTIFHDYQSHFQVTLRNETIAYRDKSLQLQDNSMKYLEAVSETLVPFGQSVKDLGPIILDMKELVGMVSQTLTTATNDFGEVAKGLNESVFAFKTEIEKALKESSDIMTKNAGEMGNSINRFNETIKTSFEDFSKSVNETLMLISNTLVESTGTMEKTISGSIESTQSVIDKLDRHLGGIDLVLSETNATLALINEKFGEMREVIDRVASSAAQVAGDSSKANIELTGVFKEKGILNKQLQTLIDSQEKLNRLVEVFPQERLTEIGQELGQIKDTVKRLTTSNASITDVFKENGLLNSQLQSLLNSQEKLNGLVEAFPQQRLTEIGQELGQIKNTVERLSNSTSTLYNELPSSLDGRGFLGAKLSSLTDNHQDISKKILEAIQLNSDKLVHTTKRKDNGNLEQNGETKTDSELPIT